MTIEWLENTGRRVVGKGRFSNYETSVRANIEFCKGNISRTRIAFGKKILERCGWAVADVITLGRDPKTPNYMHFKRIQVWPYERRNQNQGFALCTAKKREIDGGKVKNCNVTLPVKLNKFQKDFVPLLYKAELRVVAYTPDDESGITLTVEYDPKDLVEPDQLPLLMAERTLAKTAVKFPTGLVAQAGRRYSEERNV